MYIYEEGQPMTFILLDPNEQFKNKWGAYKSKSYKCYHELISDRYQYEQLMERNPVDEVKVLLNKS